MAKKIDMQREVEKAFNYPSYYYLRQPLLDGDLLTPEEQREELRHLLRVAHARQQHLRRSRFADREAAQTRLPSMKSLTTSRAIANALADVSLFIRSRRSTVRGAEQYEAEIRESLSATFRNNPEVNFNDPNFNWEQFGRYMWDLKKAGKASEGQASQQAVKMYFLARGVGLTAAGLRDNYEKFLDREAELRALYKENPYGRRNTSGAKMLERLDNM